MRSEYMHPADQLLAVMQRIYDRKMTTTSGGNLSIRDAEGNIWITPASIDKGTLTRRDIVCVKPSGEIVGIHKPSSELPFHASVYRQRPDLNAVLHAHPPGLVAFSIVRTMPRLDLVPAVGKIVGKTALSDYAVPGSEKLGENISLYFNQGYNVVFLENHGVCIGDKSIFAAFQKFETIEYASRLEIEARRLGSVRPIPEELLSETRKEGKTLPAFRPETRSDAELSARRDLIPFIHRAYDQGLVISSFGSFSCRLPDGGILITPAGADRRYLAPEDLVLVKDGACEEGKTPSASLPFHEAVYKKHAGVNAVILAKPKNLMAFAVTDQVFDARTIPESYLLLRDIKKLPLETLYRDPEGAAAEISNPVPALIFENDSIAVTGETPLKAFDRLEVADATAHSILLSRPLGDIVHIHPEEVEEIKRVFNLTD